MVLKGGKGTAEVSLRTAVRGDFNIHGTKYFKDAVFHQKSKIYDVGSLLYLWLAKKTCPLKFIYSEKATKFCEIFT